MLHQHPPQHLPSHPEVLHLDSLQLEILDAERLNGAALQKISLYNNRLTTFPMPIFQHPGLKVLNISCNHITHLPAEIGLLTQLEMFDFGHN